ncbi:MAG: DUF1868 domain-containing protein, partial [Cyanobacteria bacterium P01_A01_bin.135]
MDDLYMDYINRLARMTLPDSYRSQLTYIQPSSKYSQSEAGPVPQPFPGYSVVTPPRPDDPGNEAVYAALETLQNDLKRQLGEIVAMVPPDSLHLTLADLIWYDAYRTAAQSPDFHGKLQQAIAYSFQDYQRRTAQSASPCAWQILGLVIMPRAVGVVLAPKTEAAYQQILNLRRSIYQNRSLMALGV